MLGPEDHSDDEMRRAREYMKLRKEASKNLLSYSKILEGIKDLKVQIKFFEEEIESYQEKRATFLEEEEKLAEEMREARAQKRDDLIEEIRLKQLQLKVDSEQNENNERIARAKLKSARELGEELAKQVNTSNAMNASFGSFKQVVGYTVGLLKQQTDHLLTQQKAVKMSELQMGILANRSLDYQENLYNAALATNMIGTSSAGLAKMQGDYTQEIGRTVLLTEEGHKAMAALSEGTILGQENAGRFAAYMEMFGYSAVAANEFLEETLNIATSMGLAGQKVTEETMDALKVAETFNFRNGVKGAAKMAMLATKTRLEIESIKGIADNVFNPEGAIEMAAQLSVLGGTWAQLGDPFSLMFKARNDITGLTEDIAKAAASGAEFNEETGEFEIAAAQLARLREVANATGISMAELTRSARNAAKFAKIKTEVTGNFDEDIMDFIASTAQMGENGKYQVSIDGDTVFVDELHNFTNGQLRAIADEKASLAERAKLSKTFDETWENVVNQFKATLLPGFTVIADRLTKALFDLSQWMLKEDILGKIQSTVKWVGDKLTWLVDLMEDNKLETAIALGIGGIVYALGNKASWFLNGQILGMGFNTTAMGGGGGMFGGRGKGGGTPGGGGGMFGGRKSAKGVAGPEYRTRNGVREIKTTKGKWIDANSGPGKASANWRKGGPYAAKKSPFSKLGGVGKGLGKASKLLGRVAAPLALLGMGANAYTNLNDENLSTGEGIGKTFDQNKFATAGAALGMIGGPLGALTGFGIGGILDFALPYITGGDGLMFDYGKDKGSTDSEKSTPKYIPQSSSIYNYNNKTSHINTSNIAKDASSSQAQNFNSTQLGSKSLLYGGAISNVSSTTNNTTTNLGQQALNPNTSSYVTGDTYGSTSYAVTNNNIGAATTNNINRTDASARYASSTTNEGSATYNTNNVEGSSKYISNVSKVEGGAKYASNITNQGSATYNTNNIAGSSKYASQIANQGGVTYNTNNVEGSAKYASSNINQDIQNLANTSSTQNANHYATTNNNTITNSTVSESAKNLWDNRTSSTSSVATMNGDSFKDSRAYSNIVNNRKGLSNISTKNLNSNSSKILNQSMASRSTSNILNQSKSNFSELVSKQSNSYSSLVNENTSAYSEVSNHNVNAYSSIADKNLEAYKGVSENNLTAFSNLVNNSQEAQTNLTKNTTDAYTSIINQKSFIPQASSSETNNTSSSLSNAYSNLVKNTIFNSDSLTSTVNNSDVTNNSRVDNKNITSKSARILNSESQNDFFNSTYGNSVFNRTASTQVEGDTYNKNNSTKNSSDSQQSTNSSSYVLNQMKSLISSEVGNQVAYTSPVTNYNISMPAKPSPVMPQEAQDFVSRPGQQPIPFSSADTLIGMKKGGGIDNFLSKRENSSTSGQVEVKFTNSMKIEGKLHLEGSGGQSIKLNLDDPILMRQLSRLVQEELTTTLNGKRSPNPVN